MCSTQKWCSKNNKQRLIASSDIWLSGKNCEIISKVKSRESYRSVELNMEENENTESILDDNLLEKNIGSGVENNIIDDLINIDIEIKIDIDNDAALLYEENILEQFETNELPIAETIDLTNDSSEDEQEEQAIDNYIAIGASLLGGKFYFWKKID